jgi:hypothetical protein
MAELTGLFGVDWATLFAVLFAAAVVAMSRRRDLEGYRIAGFLVIPLVSGVLLLIAMGIRFEDDIRRFLPFLVRPVTALVVFVLAFVVAAVADLLFTRFVRIPGRLWKGASTARLGDAGLALFIGGAAVLGFAGMVGLDTRTNILPSEPGLASRLEVAATHGLPSPPLGIALRSDRDGYLSLGARVAHFELPDGPRGPLNVTTVADGFSYTRGLTIVGDVLVVADLGPLPCPDPFPYCKGHQVPGGDEIEGERRILEGSRGRLVAFDLQPDGSLVNERVVDNDGETPNGWRAEEVLHIRPGADYGFPFDGSFGPQEVRNDLAAWFAEGVGTAGVLWSGDVGLGPGLLIGSCGHLDGLRLTDYQGEWRVESPADYARLLSLPGCVTDIKPLGEGRVILSLLQTDALYILEATGLRS